MAIIGLDLHRRESERRRLGDAAPGARAPIPRQRCSIGTYADFVGPW